MQDTADSIPLLMVLLAGKSSKRQKTKWHQTGSGGASANWPGSRVARNAELPAGRQGRRRVAGQNCVSLPRHDLNTLNFCASKFVMRPKLQFHQANGTSSFRMGFRLLSARKRREKLWQHGAKHQKKSLKSLEKYMQR